MAASHQQLAKHWLDAAAMSRSRELQLHITQIEEIRTILNSMKNLALIEIHKLTRFQSMQGQAVANIENAALDFFSFYPCQPILDRKAAHIGILIGSERGFCGDFNERLIKAWDTEAYPGMIAIGSRLGNRLKDHGRNVIASLAGANIAEEVPSIINRLIDIINPSKKVNNALILTAVYQESGLIKQRQILPPLLQPQQETPRYGNPPVLNLEAVDFYFELVEHYLYAALHEIFYLSLMAENQKRQQHLEGAIQHLDEEIISLHRKSQIYRQEEITEELEVILLNSENL